ncbi:MAG: DUF72 domain-containing protein [Tepidanaerobacteraceae bacterium]|jgi:uncharacterized protein YecE (DUF72 family)|nr:DUF72 domain-containing protein [Thermoanaerobacterales bacterium]
MILIATSGYAYKDWKGPFYPEDIKDKDMLSFYSRFFPFTEINSSYYSMPNSYMFYHMMRKTPNDFLFSVKAYGGMTHQKDLSDTIVNKFTDALKPLIEQNRLCCVLFQFPYSFHNNQANKDYLKRVREHLKDVNIAVEFRSLDWLTEETINLLKKCELSFVCVDEPPLKGLLPPVVAVTGPIGYIRFHGRNTEKWYNHQKSYERYDYLYSEEELKEWVPRIEHLAKKVKTVFIAMNNHFNAQAVINAQQLLNLIEKKNKNSRILRDDL